MLVSGSPVPDQSLIFLMKYVFKNSWTEHSGLETLFQKWNFFQLGLPKVCISFFEFMKSVPSKDVFPTLTISLYLALSFRKMSFTCSSGWRHSWRLLRRSLMCSRRSLVGELVTC